MHPSLLKAPEAVLSALLAVFALVMHVTMGNSGIAMTLDILIYAGGTLMVRWPRATAIGIGATLTAMLSLPHGTLIIGEYAVAIPVFSAAMRGRRRLAYIASAGYLTIFLIDGTYRYQDIQTFGSMLFWVTFLGTCLLLAHVLVRAQARQTRANEDAAAAQRARLSRDLHDDVASALTRIFMRAQIARLDTREREDDIAYIADEAGTALQHLRHVVQELHHGSLNIPERRLGDSQCIGAGILEECAARLRRHGFDPKVRIDDGAAQYSDVVAAAFRAVAAEATNNIIRHGDPSGLCELDLIEGGAAVSIAFTNTRRASDSAIAHLASIQNHTPLGVAGMRARTEGVGGILQSDRVGDRWVLRATFATGITTRSRADQRG